ncbi:DNA damage-inducible transcript 3 protein isoform 1-T3 [Chlamydotis macqueenii]
MAAPAGGATSALPGWELDAWYQDLQEVLVAAEPGGPSPAWGAEQAEVALLQGTEGAGGGPGGCELDAALAAELLELLGPESNTEAVGPLGPACGRNSPPQPGREQDEMGAAAGSGTKRKRCSSTAASRELAKRQERANEQRVQELMAHNERLREEIRQLSAEVERTRAALIDRIVNLR